MPAGTTWPRLPCNGSCLPRDAARDRPAAESFVGGLVARLERATVTDGVDAAEVGYLDVLDRALLDRRVTSEEVDELAAVAMMYGIGADRVHELHRDYLRGLVRIALQDGVLTTRERLDLELVAALLAVPFHDDFGAASRSRTLAAKSTAPLPATSARGGSELAGKTVCFTGALRCCYAGEPMTRAAAQALASAAGLAVRDRVTRDLDLLVVADPDTLSGKARKARDYGITIVAEAAFWPLIGVDVS